MKYLKTRIQWWTETMDTGTKICGTATKILYNNQKDKIENLEVFLIFRIEIAV